MLLGNLATMLALGTSVTRRRLQDGSKKSSTASASFSVWRCRMTEIRACSPEDAIAVGALLKQLGYVVTAQQAAKRIRQLGETGSDPIFLAVSDGRVVGVVTCHFCEMLQYDKPVMRVTALVIERQARRRGAGKLLMQHAEALAAAAGCDFVELTSATRRAEAHAFYRSIGYEANSLRYRKAALTR